MTTSQLLLPFNLGFAISSIGQELYFIDGLGNPTRLLDELNDTSLGAEVATLTDVRSLTSAAVTRAFTAGYATAGDGGHGFYRLDLTDTTSADDGGSVIVDSSGRRWKLIHDGTINPKQFGAKIDNATDDYDAWNRCITFALADDNAHLEIVMPAGISRLYRPIIKNEIRQLKIRGAGGSATSGQGSTIEYWIASPSASEAKGMFQFYSVFHVTMEDIALRVRVNGIASHVWVSALDSPSLSSHCIDFNRVHFSPGATTPCTDADVVVENAKTVSFRKCRWTEISTSNLRVGANTLDSPGTLQQGIVAGIDIEGGFFFGNVDLRHASSWNIYGCVFGEDEDAVIKSSGEGRMKNGSAIGNEFIGDSSQAAITQGTYAGSTMIEGAGAQVYFANKFRDRKVGIAVTVGYCTIGSNTFDTRRAGDKSITIDVAADCVAMLPNDHRNAFANDYVAVEDNRTSVKDQFVFSSELSGDATLAAVGSYQTVISGTCGRKLRGGKYRVTYVLVVRPSADAVGLFRAKLLIGGSDMGMITRQYGNNTSEIVMTATKVVQIAATTSASPPTVTMQLWQESGAIASTIRGGSNGNSYVQVEELS